MTHQQLRVTTTALLVQGAMPYLVARQKTHPEEQDETEDEMVAGALVLADRILAKVYNETKEEAE